MAHSARTLTTWWLRFRFLILGLTVPLLALAILSLALARPFTPSDLLLNVGTDLATIVITIWYVDWALRRHEEQQWRSSSRYISAQAGGIAHRLITAIAEPAGLGDQVYPSGDPPLYKRHITEIQNQIISNVRNLDTDTIIAHIDKLSAGEWHVLMHGVQDLTSEASALIAQFATRLGPTELEAILKLRRDMSSAFSSYDLFRPFLGVPVQDLPKMKDGKPWEYSALSTIRIGVELRMALDQALAVIDTFNFVAEDSPIDWNTETQKHWSKYRQISRFHPHPPSAFQVSSPE